MAESLGPLSAMVPDDDAEQEAIGGSDDSADYSPGAAPLSYPGIAGASEAFQRLIKSNEDARAALQRARYQIQTRKWNRAQALLAMSAAFGTPTRTGAFGESLANVANAVRGPLADRDALQEQKTKDVLGLDTQIAGLDQSTAKAQLDLAALNAKLAGDQRKVRPVEVIKNGKRVYVTPSDSLGLEAPPPGEARPIEVMKDGKRIYAMPSAAIGLEAPPPADARPVEVMKDGKRIYATPSGAIGAEAPPPAAETGTPSFTHFDQKMPDGSIQPMVFDNRTGQKKPDGDPYTPEAKLSPQGKTQAESKLTTLAVLRDQLQTMRDHWEPLKDSMSAGLGQGWIPSEEGRLFDKAVNSARGTIRQLTRVPGEGSMSDWEGKIDQAKLPDRNDYESASEESMDNLEDMINRYEFETKKLLGYKDLAPPEKVRDRREGAAATSSSDVIQYDKFGKRVKK